MLSFLTELGGPLHKALQLVRAHRAVCPGEGPLEIRKRHHRHLHHQQISIAVHQSHAQTYHGTELFVLVMLLWLLTSNCSVAMSYSVMRMAPQR
jgi:hypothetical protein